jgi:hypothetical protein
MTCRTGHVVALLSLLGLAPGCVSLAARQQVDAPEMYDPHIVGSLRGQRVDTPAALVVVYRIDTSLVPAREIPFVVPLDEFGRTKPPFRFDGPQASRSHVANNLSEAHRQAVLATRVDDAAVGDARAAMRSERFVKDSGLDAIELSGPYELVAGDVRVLRFGPGINRISDYEQAVARSEVLLLPASLPRPPGEREENARQMAAWKPLLLLGDVVMTPIIVLAAPSMMD